jgi:hypothetical protein
MRRLRAHLSVPDSKVQGRADVWIVPITYPLEASQRGADEPRTRDTTCCWGRSSALGSSPILGIPWKSNAAEPPDLALLGGQKMAPELDRRHQTSLPRLSKTHS